MTSARLIRLLIQIADESFIPMQVVDVVEINAKLYLKLGKRYWSSSEIAGAMPRVSHIYKPTGEKNIYGLNTFVVHGSDENE